MSMSTERIKARIDENMFCIKKAPQSNVFILTLPNSECYRIVTATVPPEVAVVPFGACREGVTSSILSCVSHFFKNENSTEIKKILESKKHPYTFLRDKALDLIKSKCSERRRSRIRNISEQDAGDRIKQAIKAYLHLKRQKIDSAKSLIVEEEKLPLHQRTYPLGFITMKHNTKINWRGEPRLYYVDIDRKLKTKRDPDYVRHDGLSGSFKQVVADDDFAIELEPKNVTMTDKQGDQVEVSGDDFDLESALTNKSVLQVLSDYSSICQTVTVAARRMIGENGGVDIFESFVSNGDCIKLKYCEQLCVDIADAHSKGIFFRDIKTENMVLQEFKKGTGSTIFIKKPMVQMIDTDLAVTPRYGVKGFNCGTPSHMTEGLVKARKRADKAVEEAMTQSEQASASTILDYVEKALDNYALIISLYEMTEPGGSGQLAQMLLLDRNGTQYSPNIGFLALCGNQGIFFGWVDKYVKKQYRNAVCNFMKTPSQYPLQASVHEIIDWSCTNR